MPSWLKKRFSYIKNLSVFQSSKNNKQQNKDECSGSSSSSNSKKSAKINNKNGKVECHPINENDEENEAEQSKFSVCNVGGSN